MISQRTALSPEPMVRLENAFQNPYDNAVATARTCYSSKGIINEDQASAKPERRDALARSIYDAGHHTTFQHAHFQFVLENVSRQFLWTFLHSHPFYNSEQVSQRYVEVSHGHFAIPPLLPAEADPPFSARDAEYFMDSGVVVHVVVDAIAPAVAPSIAFKQLLHNRCRIKRPR